jgi:hypothetical protein
MLLAGDNEVFVKLRKQYLDIEIILIEDTEAGFYVDFNVKDKKLKLPLENDTFQLGNVSGAVNGVEDAIGFVLFVKDGFIAMLEGYTLDLERWPLADTEIMLSYEK